MTRSSPRPKGRTRAERDSQSRATLVFREFVRRLEQLDMQPRKLVREASR